MEYFSIGGPFTFILPTHTHTHKCHFKHNKMFDECVIHIHITVLLPRGIEELCFQVFKSFDDLLFYKCRLLLSV